VPRPSQQVEAFVLLKRPPSDSFQNYTVFSAEHGTFLVLQRTSQKSTQHTLDLFDEASLLIETSNQGQTWFVKESQLITRHSGIGQSYPALLHASHFGALIARNHVHEESRAHVAALLRQAFTAFASAARPNIAHFKALYCFARDEGYPIKQHWIPTLPPEDRRQVAELLNKPLSQQIATDTAVTRLHNRLEEYLQGHTEILID
jgi:hypothetical protein